MLRSHWKATVIATVVFLVGIGIGAAAGGSPKTKTVTGRIINHTITVIRKVPVTHVVYRTRIVTHTVTAKPAASPPPPPSAALSFSGSGGLTMRPFDLSHDATMYWTNDGGYFGLYDHAPGTTDPVPVNSQASSGQTYLTAGHYELQVNAVGNWTMTIK